MNGKFKVKAIYESAVYSTLKKKIVKQIKKEIKLWDE